MPRFSVVIPLYNKEGYILNTINSVLAQTYIDFELIIINDRSTDTSLKIAENIEDSRIQIIQHSVNKGLSASRNTGIKNAKSEYIAFLDADDLWKPTFLEKIDLLITDYPEASLFASKYEVLLKNGKRITHHFKINNFKIDGIIPNFFESNLNQSIYYPSCLCVQKKVFEDVGYYNEAINYSEDVDFNIRAHASYKLAYLDDPLVTYLLVSENQITQNSLVGKTIPDYAFYETQFKGRPDIKKYLDFQRYLKAKLFKLSNERSAYTKLLNEISKESLNYRQILLLRLPRFLLIGITKLKLLFQRFGIEINSY